MRPENWLRRRVFGVIVPYIGWDTWPCHRNGEPFFVGLDGELTRSRFEADFLVVEWLGIGTTLMRGQVREAGSEA